MSKGRDYCCCAIPLVNAGVYITLIEQTALGIIVGALSVATTSIVGSATPSFSSLILGIIAFVAAGVQVLGFIGVWRENISVFRRYITLHGVVTALGFSVAATWIIWSAIGHDNAKQRCITDFFSSTSTSNSQEADTLCNIFPWVSVGIMGALWLLLASVQLYLFIVLSSYGKNQRRDHDRYDQLNDSQPLKTEDIPLESEPWTNGREKRGYRHLRQESGASVSDVMNQPSQQPRDTMSIANYGYESYDPQPSQPSYPLRPYRRESPPVQGNSTPFNVNDTYGDTPGHSQSVDPHGRHPWLPST